MSINSICSHVDSLLKPLGFTRHKAVWNRTQGSFIDVVDIQNSKAGDAITVNAGVLHMDVHMTCWASEPATVAEESSCTVRSRIGQLIDGKDHWWQLDDFNVQEEVAAQVSRHVLPFFERMHSPEAMESFLMTTGVTGKKYPPPVIYLAILKSERGDRTGACELLAELGAEVKGAWRKRIGEVAERLGCL